MGCVTLDNAKTNISFVGKLASSVIRPDCFFANMDTNHARCLAHVFHLVAIKIISTFEKTDAILPQSIQEALEQQSYEDPAELDLADLELDEEGSLETPDQVPVSTQENIQLTQDTISAKGPIEKIRKLFIKIKATRSLRFDFLGLQKHHRLPTLRPVIDVRTRWNSTFNMLNWGIKNKEVKKL